MEKTREKNCYVPMIDFYDDLFQQALKNSSLSIWIYDIENRRIIQTEHSIKMHGMGSIVSDIPQSFVNSGFVYKDDVKEYLKMFDKIIGGEKFADGVFRIRNCEGSGYWYEHISLTVKKIDGGSYALGISENVTENLLKLGNFSREEKLRRIISGNVFVGILLNLTQKRIDETYTYMDSEKENAAKYSYENIFDLIASNVYKNAEVSDYISDLSTRKLIGFYNNGQKLISVEYKRKCGDGTLKWANLEIHLLNEPVSGDVIAFIYIENIDERKRLYDDLQTLAETDSLTGLLNHSSVEKYVVSFIKNNGGANYALIIIDLDNFKQINDNFGHQSGDKILKKIADTLKNNFRKSDVVGRIGGDEFAIFIKNVPDVLILQNKAAAVSKELQFVQSGLQKSVFLTASMGISYSKGERKNYDMLYREADSALYMSKNSGKNRVSIFNQDNVESVELSFNEMAADNFGIINMSIILNNIECAFIICDVKDNFKIKYISPNYFKKFRSPSEGLIEKNWDIIESVFQEDKANVKEVLQKTSETGEKAEVFYRIILSGGKLLWRKAEIMKVPGEGKGDFVLAILTDVNECKQMKEELEESKCLLKFAVDSGLKFYEFDIKTGSQRSYDVGKFCFTEETLINDIPESLIRNKKISPESNDALINFYGNIYKGIPEYSCCAEFAENGRHVWRKISYTLKLGKNGEAEKAMIISKRTEECV